MKGQLLTTNFLEVWEELEWPVALFMGVTLYPELASLQGENQNCIQLERCSSVVD